MKRSLALHATGTMKKSAMSTKSNHGGEKSMACLLGGAVGDALGAPIEFMPLKDIRQTFGPDGLADYAPAYGRVGAVTDDTQMTLFTAEGVLRAFVRLERKGIASVVGVAGYAYKRWLYTQEHKKPPSKKETRQHDWLSGWLITVPELYHQRAPGNTCLAALRDGSENGGRNDSKGCGGIMRMAPVGLAAFVDDPFQEGMWLAALTHGHPTGQIASGAFASLVRRLYVEERPNLPDAVLAVMDEMKKYPDHRETLASLALAVDLARDAATPTDTAIQRLGGGWVAEEALAVAVYCCLKAANFRDGVLLAVNHDGDSDSTGSIAGNILGLVYGLDAIPGSWLRRLELRRVIAEIAVDLHDLPLRRDCTDAEADAIWNKYPGY